MADEVIKRQTCPDCGKLTMFESSGITICGACGQFGGKVIKDFEELLDQNMADAQQKIDEKISKTRHR